MRFQIFQVIFKDSKKLKQLVMNFVGFQNIWRLFNVFQTFLIISAEFKEFQIIFEDFQNF